MSTSATQQTAPASPSLQARTAGGLYVIVIIAAGFAEAFVRGRLVVRNDPAATAANILAHETLYRLGGAADLINFACYVAVIALFYHLFKCVNRSLSLVATFLGLVGCATGAVMCLFHFAPLTILSGAPYLSVFSAPQLQSLALLLIQLQARTYSVAMLFFGSYCLLIGWLIFRSTFLPRILGALLAISGLGYLIGMLARFILPAFAAHLFPYILWPGLVAEASLTLWLIAAGVNVQRWKAPGNS